MSKDTTSHENTGEPSVAEAWSQIDDGLLDEWAVAIRGWGEQAEIECSGGDEVGVSWDEGLVLHEGDADWHLWDESVYGARPSDGRVR